MDVAEHWLEGVQKLADLKECVLEFERLEMEQYGIEGDLKFDVDCECVESERAESETPVSATSSDEEDAARPSKRRRV